MPAVLLLLATLLFGPLAWADSSAPGGAPSYSAATIVNAADGRPGALSPNAIGTIYGTGLALTTRALSPSDISGGLLPTTLPGTSARVLVGGIAANIYYASPTQINFLVPSKLLPGRTDVQVTVAGLNAPAAYIDLAPAGPALFELGEDLAIATRLDGSVVNAGAPGKPGEILTLYATGLGETTPPAQYGRIVTQAATIKQISGFRLLLDGSAVASNAILYAGLTPGFAGLYQINFKLPDEMGENPELRIAVGDAISRPGLKLAIKP